MFNELNRNVTWRDVIDLISMFGIGFLTLYAIACQYYGAIGAIVAIFTWYHSRTDRRLKKLEHELKVLKEVNDIKP